MNFSLMVLITTFGFCNELVRVRRLRVYLIEGSMSNILYVYRLLIT